MFGLPVTGVFRLFLLLAAGFWLSACASTSPHYASPVRGTMKPYEVAGHRYAPKPQPHYNETGVASWYGYGHEGATTADGERFDTNRLAAAHKTLPIPCMVEVTNLENGKKLVVRVNDRGPFVDGRIIDLTHAAAQKLGYADKGVAHVRVRYLGPAKAGQSAPLFHEAAAPKTRGDFVVQAGAFSQRENAERASRLLSGAVKAERHDGETVYRVVTGPWPDAQTAERARADAADHGFTDARVLSAGL